MASSAAIAAEEIEDKGKRAGVEFYQFSFVDLFGVQRSKLVPAARVRSMAESGAGFAGFAAHLDMTPADGDLLALPDPASFAPLPWNPNVGWLACDLVLNGNEFEQGPRNVLRRVLRRLEEQKKAVLKTGVECEFFLLKQEARPAIADEWDTQSKSCYDAQALMRRYGLITGMMKHMSALGWGPYQADHEDGSGQFEVNWDYSTALQTADRHVMFKYMARTMAEEAGLRASFMPKPFQHLTGSGCHVHISLHAPCAPPSASPPSSGADGRGGGANLCQAPPGPPAAPHALSPLALDFLGGMLAHAPAMAALTNPSVNSYKRLHAGSTRSGATWSPSRVSWGGNDRTVMVRVPDAPRMELRLADMAANPYLLPAAIAAAGLAGGGEASGALVAALDKGGAGAGGGQTGALPSSLGAALEALEGSLALREQLGGAFVDAYLKLRKAQWEEYSLEVSDWELRNTLDV